jgi:hypothetical protein
MFRCFAKPAALVAAALLAASCMESAGPRNGERQPGAPLFSFSPGGITLDRENGTFNQRGIPLLIKGFNPISPHNGDAVIATFYWVGSTNIIDSVRDVMTSTPYTPVGNTYHLVKYVTAGGLSMATYVATNIQNFPDAAAEPNDVYAVGAWLNQSVSDGGIRLSAWVGVEDVFAQAIGTGAGAPRSASGTGTIPTVVGAGPIAHNAGALVYGASAVMPAVNGEPDPAFVFISTGSDLTMKDIGQYAVPASSGAADPHWTWYFDQQPGGATWLVTSLTLNAAPPPPPLAPPTMCSGSAPFWADGARYVRVTWVNGDATASTEFQPTFRFGNWGSPGTLLPPGTTSYNQNVTGQSGTLWVRLRHVKPGYVESSYCNTSSSLG